MGIHSTGILQEKMGAKQGCCYSTSSTTPIKVYRNTPFLTVQLALDLLNVDLIGLFVGLFPHSFHFLLFSALFLSREDDTHDVLLSSEFRSLC